MRPYKIAAFFQIIIEQTIKTILNLSRLHMQNILYTVFLASPDLVSLTQAGSSGYTPYVAYDKRRHGLEFQILR